MLRVVLPPAFFKPHYPPYSPVPCTLHCRNSMVEFRRCLFESWKDGWIKLSITFTRKILCIEYLGLQVAGPMEGVKFYVTFALPNRQHGQRTLVMRWDAHLPNISALPCNQTLVQR